MHLHIMYLIKDPLDRIFKQLHLVDALKNKFGDIDINISCRDT